MDFNLTDEQQLLQNVTRQLLSRKYDTEARNKAIATGRGWNKDVWEQLAQIGVLSLGFEPGEAGAIEIMVVQTEIGRSSAPEPVVHAALIPGGLLAEAGNAQQRALLGDVAAGTTLLSFAHSEPGMRSPFDSVGTHAEFDAGRWMITGSKNPVFAGDSADHLIVSAALPDSAVGLFLVRADAAVRRPYRTFDGHRAAEIVLDRVEAEPLGDGGDADDHISRTLVRYVSALSAEAVGCMDEATRLTTDYLTTRRQFGHSLNSFQALTQRAADMYVALELARSMSYYLAMSITEATFNPATAARVKLQIARSGKHIAEEAVQLHGGIGMTAEHPVSHLAARLTAINNTLGRGDDHLRELGRHIGNYATLAI